MKEYYTTNSHYLTYTFLFRKVGRIYFLNLGVKGLKEQRNWEAFIIWMGGGGDQDHSYRDEILTSKPLKWPEMYWEVCKCHVL